MFGCKMFSEGIKERGTCQRVLPLVHGKWRIAGDVTRLWKGVPNIGVRRESSCYRSFYHQCFAFQIFHAP